MHHKINYKQPQFITSKILCSQKLQFIGGFLKEFVLHLRLEKNKLQFIQICLICEFFGSYIFLFQMALYLENILSRIHIRTTDFFLKNFKKFKDDVTLERIKDISDIELECLGYGIFDKESVLRNFIKYTTDLLQQCRKRSEVRTLKITINGFSLESEPKLFANLASEIVNIKDSLKVLWIHTANLTYCALEDFDILFSLCFQLSDINFEDFSLQCANWRFHKGQPRFQDLKTVFNNKINSLDSITKINNRFFRLQISGWFYDSHDARYFLGFKPEDTNQNAFNRQVQGFHLSMQKLLKNLLEGMEHIQEVQLDMRNYNQILKMKSLKKRLDNVTKENTYQRSIMSKRYDIQADEAERQLKLSIVM